MCDDLYVLTILQYWELKSYALAKTNKLKLPQSWFNVKDPNLKPYVVNSNLKIKPLANSSSQKYHASAFLQNTINLAEIIIKRTLPPLQILRPITPKTISENKAAIALYKMSSPSGSLKELRWGHKLTISPGRAESVSLSANRMESW